MSSMKTIWACTLSPRLYKVHEALWKTYEPNNFERWGDYVVNSFSAIWSVGIYTLPLIAALMYRRNNTMTDNMYTMSKYAASAGFIFITSLAVRGCARSTNPMYIKFIKTLTKAHESYTYESKQQLQKYDFEFWAWPVDYKVLSNNLLDGKPRVTINNSKRYCDNYIIAVPCKILSYLLANTIAIKMMYPGSTSIVNMLMKSTMLQGRIDLIDRGGERSKLLTFNNNTIDTIFIDKRHKSKNGHILVITCEGNCGFYEAGIMSTPLAKDYSIVGWNHPGFGGSTGTPFPEQEIDAIDAVIKYSIDKLNFTVDNIILNGWSIGGFTSTWAAMNYQNLHGLILDATFDDVLYLAKNTMPKALDAIVKNLIREYLNLNIAEQLKKYNGRVLLIRRTDDEIMCTPAGSLAHNRANYLLIKLLIHRYPKLFENTDNKSVDVLKKYLSMPTHDSNGKTTKSLAARTQGLFSDGIPLVEDICLSKIMKDIENNNGQVKYPSTLGDNCDSISKQHLVVYLANKYMKDQNSGHNVRLNQNLFKLGWDPRA
ncbi:phosphatidylserine lipase ABHD16A isoform X2 [Aphidius gifuensis]|uniref:phosphatidylserine lipase ABHD16A isoform X2 n=1 Tax=Aphidius gifuensis TaxID=684658 RepID=UPI001CDB7153|nr:phosphatidylserine lipase ABHD16A isoform X2 [Aphidius gifuensis]